VNKFFASYSSRKNGDEGSAQNADTQKQAESKK
jgi:hypothetical protein